MGRSLVETVMGAVVLLVAVAFLAVAYETAQVKVVKGYSVKAAFYKIGGLKKGSDVRISGIKVGTVNDQSLDPETFDAVVSMTILPDVKIPASTVATIASEGLLGGKYVRLEPGNGPPYIESGATIAKTKDYRSLEDQVGEIIFLATGGKDDGPRP